MIWLVAALAGSVALSAVLAWRLGIAHRELSKPRAPIWPDPDMTIRDLIRQRDKWQRQAFDMQMAAAELMREREEMFRELRGRSN